MTEAEALAPPRPTMDKAQWDEEVADMRPRLLYVQQQLREANVPTVLILAGADGVKSQTVNRMVSWLDPRGIDVHAFTRRELKQSRRPEMWLYFTTLPAKGRIGLYFGSWYAPIVSGRLERKMRKREMKRRLVRIEAFERSLVADGYLVLKVWLELTREEQQERLEKLSAQPDERWKVWPSDWKHLENFDRFPRLRDQFIKRTGRPGAEWNVIPAADDRWREIAVARHFATRAEDHLRALDASDGAVPSPVQLVTEPEQEQESPLVHVDLTEKLSSDEYGEAMAVERKRIRDLTLQLPKARKAMVLAFEGWDAAGKGGTIRRLVEPMDARRYRVIPVGAPTDQEQRHHYLWRFWRHVPPPGDTVIYDRSWYGRVLVERVEGLAREDEWRRAYGEIREFEELLTEHGILLGKFWLHLSPEEQLARFQSREETPHKRYKLTDDDWRNREKRPDYEAAVIDMYHETHRPPYAPWTIIPSEDKNVARVRVLRTVADVIEQALG